MLLKSWTRHIRATALVTITVATLVFGSGSPNNSKVPVISSISPSTVANGGPGFTMKVLGSNFCGRSVVRCNGSQRSTSVLTSTQVQATILSSDIAIPGTAQITVCNPGGNGGTSNAVILTIVDPPLTITTTSLPNGTVGVAYIATLSASGGTQPYTWSVSTGSLPTGLKLSTSGTISGTPTAAGSYGFAVQVRDSGGATATQSYTVSVVSTLTITTTSLPNGTVNVAYSATLSASGGRPPYTWTLVSGELPPGLSLSSDGTVSGTPTTVGSYTFTMQVQDSTGLTATQPYTVSVSSQLPVGCGAFTDNSTCGNVGDPYEGHGPPPSQQPVSACGTILLSNTNYKLSGNIGPDATALCLTIGFGISNVNLDLGGFTVTGAIFDESNGNGNTIYNGTVDCNRPQSIGDPVACLKGYSQITTSQWRAHHLTINNANGNGMAAQFEEDTDQTFSGPGTGLGTPIRFDHLTIVGPNVDNGASFRWISIQVPNYGDTEEDDNYVHCPGSTPPANLGQCQGPGVGHVHHGYVHNNELIADVYTGTADNARLVECDGNPGDCEVYANDIYPTNNRAIRFRGAPNEGGWNPPFTGNVYGNFIHDITQGGRFSSIHIGENDTGLYPLQLQIYNNTFEVGSGGGVISVGAANGVTAHDNTVTCYGGSCTGVGYILHTDTWPYAGSLTSATIKNTTLPSGWGSNPAVEACGPAGNPSYVCSDDTTDTTTVTYCNTGIAVGNGEMTESCP